VNIEAASSANSLVRLWRRLTNPEGLWVYAVIALCIILTLAIIFDPSYREAFDYIWPGLQMTLFLTITSFALALVIGLFMGLARVSSNMLLYNVSTFYVETIRGIPILVQLLYVTFVVFPLITARSRRMEWRRNPRYRNAHSCHFGSGYRLWRL
jgi:His/Glu/Gln/Arg/opine family amino acid ABC transporter permease subunit